MKDITDPPAPAKLQNRISFECGERTCSDPSRLLMSSWPQGTARDHHGGVDEISSI